MAEEPLRLFVLQQRVVETRHHIGAMLRCDLPQDCDAIAQSLIRYHFT